MIEFREDLLSDPNLLVNCRTEEQAINFCTWMDSKGLDWQHNGGLFTYWHNYEEQTVYSANLNWFSGVEHYPDKIILSYEEALLNQPVKECVLELTEDNIVPDVCLEYAGEYNLHEVLDFTKELLELNFRVTFSGVGNEYELKGYKKG